ncbi:hypothetical protein LEP1GSC186_3916 [Leptospira noguchii serovar Autumnalis str. ZUN142]|uniref:Uncharacterized protein n=1 Tax=Leptospira noguchii serovar Autumnalis str. ZUN142 TaxID=1085540 RepID=M6UGU8_9LEPT|nr:hypothetical protein LEP1GSC186_3916 [Leptospira noguchii serovar Autumnalis str. ZUN142]
MTGMLETQQNAHYGSRLNSAERSLWIAFKLSRTLTMDRV